MKNNQKCVRMSDEILEVVESMAGDGFNEKFENLVRNYKMELPELQKKTEFLRKEVNSKVKSIEELNVQIRSRTDIITDLNQAKIKLLNIMDSLYKY